MTTKKLNLIIILLDALRADRLDKIDYLKGLSQKGACFSNMISASPYSICSWHSIFSGAYPQFHGVNGYFKMFKFRGDKYKTLTEYLSDAGYYCAADVVQDSLVVKGHFDKLNVFGKISTDLISRHKKLISEVANKKPFFVFLDYNKICVSLIEDVKKKYGESDDKFFKNNDVNGKRYDTYLPDIDHYLKEILNHVKQLNLENDTLVVILNDHGASLGEKKGELIYGVYLYDYTIKTFCVIVGPGIKKKEVKRQTRTIDVLPTLLDLLSIKVGKDEHTFQGKSLVTFLSEKENEDRIAISETGGLGGPWPSPTEHNVFSVRHKSYKLIYYKTPNKWEFYNLESDPNESNPIENKPRVYGIMKTVLVNFMKGDLKEI